MEGRGGDKESWKYPCPQGQSGREGERTQQLQLQLILSVSSGVRLVQGSDDWGGLREGGLSGSVKHKCDTFQVCHS